MRTLDRQKSCGHCLFILALRAAWNKFRIQYGLTFIWHAKLFQFGGSSELGMQSQKFLKRNYLRRLPGLSFPRVLPTRRVCGAEYQLTGKFPWAQKLQRRNAEKGRVFRLFLARSQALSCLCVTIKRGGVEIFVDCHGFGAVNVGRWCQNRKCSSGQAGYKDEG